MSEEFEGFDDTEFTDEDDFNFYGEEAEERDVKDIEGITDKVTEFTYTNLEYPCIMFKEGFSCPQHQMKVISNMVKTNTPDKDTSLYFMNGGELFKLGMLSGQQIDPLLELVGVDSLVAYYDADTKLEGDKIYTLCVL